MSSRSTIRVVLPHHLRTLARVDREISVDVAAPATIGSVLDAVEAAHPALRGTMRDQTTLQRRAFIRWFACEQDLSHEPATTPLPQPLVDGQDVFRILGAIAGGARQ